MSCSVRSQCTQRLRRLQKKGAAAGETPSSRLKNWRMKGRMGVASMRKSPERLLRLRNWQLAMRRSASEQSPSAVIVSCSVLEVLGKHATSPWTRRRLHVRRTRMLHGPPLPSLIAVDKSVIDLSLLELDGKVIPRFSGCIGPDPTIDYCSRKSPLQLVQNGIKAPQTASLLC